MSKTFVFTNVIYANGKFTFVDLIEKEFNDFNEACDYAKQITGKEIYMNLDGDKASIQLDKFYIEDKPVITSLGI